MLDILAVQFPTFGKALVLSGLVITILCLFLVLAGVLRIAVRCGNGYSVVVWVSAICAINLVQRAGGTMEAYCLNDCIPDWLGNFVNWYGMPVIESIFLLILICSMLDFYSRVERIQIQCLRGGQI